MNSPAEIAINTAIGQAAILFANLEFFLSGILSAMLDPSPQSIAGSFVCDSFTLSQTIGHIRKVAKFRFCHDEAMLTRIESLCTEAGRLRDTRNLFVHGVWNFEPKRLAKGEIVCFDMKWETKKNAKQWSRGKEHVFNLATLNRVLVATRRLNTRVFQLLNDLKAAKMMPMAQGIRGSRGQPLRGSMGQPSHRC